MSSCGYYSCFKGKPTCKHPTYGDDYTKQFKYEKSGRYHPCERCKRNCGGIYPSQLPKADVQNCIIDILDKNGNVIG